MEGENGSSMRRSSNEETLSPPPPPLPHTHTHTHSRTTHSEITACDFCSLGTYIGVAQSTACAECPLDTITGIVTGRTNCSFCNIGEVRDPDRVYCSKCEAGTYKTLTLDNSKYYCAECPPLKHAIAGSTTCSTCPKTGEFPDTTRGICLSCAIGSYRARDAREDACTRCPPRGVRCADSSLQVRTRTKSTAPPFVHLL